MQKQGKKKQHMLWDFILCTKKAIQSLQSVSVLIPSFYF